MDRKQFLRTAGAACGAGLIAGCAREVADRRALDPPLERVGLQLYTIRSLMAADAAAALDAAAAIGYAEVEFAGYHGHAPATVRRWLDAAGLTAPAAHVGIDDLAVGPGLDASVEAALALGHRWLALPWIGEEMRTADGYRAAADLLNAAGAAAAPAGVRIGYHNHAFEFEPVADDPTGATGYSILADNLDPELVDLEIDLHWSAVAGVDALDLFARRPGRFPLCHVKDLTADGRMADAGAGMIEWAAIFAQSERAGLRHYFVEHDSPPDPLASAEASYRYLAAA